MCHKFKTGDKVKVIDRRYSYTSYTAMADIIMLNNYMKGSLPTNLKTYRVVGKAQHETKRDSAYVGIEDERGCQYIVGSKGLELIRPTYPNPPHKHAEFIKAWADGAKIEVWSKPLRKWVDIKNPNWLPEAEYRIKPTNPNADKISELEATITKVQQQIKELKEG